MTNQPKPEVKGIEQFRNVERFERWSDHNTVVEDDIYVLASRYDALFAFAEEQQREVATMGIIEFSLRNANMLAYMGHWETRCLKAEAKVEEQQKEVERLRREKAEAGAMMSRVTSASLGTGLALSNVLKSQNQENAILREKLERSVGQSTPVRPT